MKQVGKIYSAVDADELEVGDICCFGNSMYDIYANTINDVGIGSLHCLLSNTETFRFQNDCGHKFNLAKLICPKKHAEIYKAFKNGAEVERYCYDPDDYYDDGEWLLDNKPSWDEDFDFRIKE